MFIQLASALVETGNQPYDLFRFHPLQLQAATDVLYEEARTRLPPVAPVLANAAIADRTPEPEGRLSLRDELLRVLGGYGAGRELGGNTLANAVQRLLTRLDVRRAPRLWHHLAYAFLVENTRVVEIGGRILHEALHGERLGPLSLDGQRWVRATEQLFFQDQGFSFISSIQSSVRPDARATRRNAYYRMFRMELNHGTADNQPYPYVKAEAANHDFVATLEDLLREIWRGYINARNTSGANTTDVSQIVELVLRLQQMLGERRIGGNLAREEYAAVCMATWFDLTLSGDTPIVRDLKAEATAPEERLRKLGERVGIVPHSQSRSLLLLANPMSRLLTEVEAGLYSTTANAPLLYDPAQPGNVTADTLDIVNRWSIATGRDLKAMPVSTLARS
jgi:hypothetical protein